MSPGLAAALAGALAICACSKGADEPMAYRNAAGAARFIEVDPARATAKHYQDAVARWCGASAQCQLHFFPAGTQIPSAMPMTPAQTAARAAQYTRNAHRQHEQWWWNCERAQPLFEGADCMAR